MGNLPRECLLLLVIFTVAKTGVAQQIDIDCGYFNSPPPNITIAEGQSTCVQCRHPGRRTARWQIWMDMSYTNINLGSEPSECSCAINNTGNPSTLCFDSVDSNIENMYRCIAQREGSLDEAACPFQIELADPPRLVSTSPLSITRDVGTTVEFSPSVEFGNPPGNVTWYRNGNVVQTGGRYSLVDGGRGLQIGSVESSDRGVYTYNVSNIAGRVSGEFWLLVNFAEIDSFDFEHVGGNVEAECVGRGYPLNTDFQLMSPAIIQFSGTGGNTNFEVQRTLRTSVSLMQCPFSLTCTVTPGVNTDVSRTINPCTVPPPSITTTAALCDPASSGPLPTVTGVSVNIVTTAVNTREVTLAWRPSTEEYVVGYQVTVDPCPPNLTCPVMVEGRDTNSLSFPEQICDSLNYVFQLQSIDSCGGTSPASSVVERTCEQRNQLMDLVTGVDYVTVTWNFVDPDDLQSLNVTVVQLDEPTTLTYTVDESAFRAQRVCVKGLKMGVDYQVCLSSQFKSNPLFFPRHCGHVMTDSEGGTAQPNCLAPITMVTVTTPPPAGVMIQHWQIAIIVVGALAIVAVVFCLVGLCFACQSSKQKVDFGSSSSLNTDTYNNGSIRDVQRSNSPSRSCLSYHIKGHSTNWSDHVDTLRQMETEGGTNV